MNKYSYKFNNFLFEYYLRDDVDFSVFNEIFKFNEYKSCIDKIKSSSFPIVDIGAHVGFFSIFAFCLNDKIDIFAIEPEVGNLDVLKKNIDLNNLKNVKILNCAIGDETKFGEIIVSEDSINNKILKNNTKFNTKLKSNLKTQKIKIFSFKDFLKNNNIEKVSLVKMDIEGFEYDVIDSLGSQDFLKIESFIFEYHENVYIKKDRKYLENRLRENGFSVSVFPSKFDNDLGFIFAINKRVI